MRNSRIMAISLFLCLTVAGTSTLWADPVEKTVRLGDEDFIVRYDGNTKAFDSIRNQRGEVQVVREGPLWNLRLHEHGFPPQRILSIPDGTIAITGDGTCVWYFFAGKWKQYCN